MARTVLGEGMGHFLQLRRVSASSIETIGLHLRRLDAKRQLRRLWRFGRGRRTRPCIRKIRQRRIPARPPWTLRRTLFSRFWNSTSAIWTRPRSERFPNRLEVFASNPAPQTCSANDPSSTRMVDVLQELADPLVNGSRDPVRIGSRTATLALSAAGRRSGRA